MVAGALVAGLANPIPAGASSATHRGATPHSAAKVAAASKLPPEGYRAVGSDGGVFDFGTNHYLGSVPGLRVKLAAPVASMAPTRTGLGYWVVTQDGGIFSFGDAHFYGSLGGDVLTKPIVAMAATPDSKGYWLVGTDGGVFAFGDAHFYGSLGRVHLTEPIVAMAATPDGKGYWLVGSDGGVFAFGDAHFYGSLGGVHLTEPIVAMTSAFAGSGATGEVPGYWLMGADGGVFAFGVPYHGSLPGVGLVTTHAVGITPAVDNGGYWIGTADGTVKAFGDAPFLGDFHTAESAQGHPSAVVAAPWLQLTTVATPGATGAPTPGFLTPTIKLGYGTGTGATEPVGTEANLTVQVDVSGEPDIGVSVTLKVTGPNAGTYTAKTGATGTADFSYAGTAAGEDQITASSPYDGQTLTSSSIWITWTQSVTKTVYSGSKVILTPGTAGPDPTHTSQALTATLTNSTGQPIAGMELRLNVAGANPTTVVAPTNASGVATFSYTGSATGTDTATAVFPAGPDTATSNSATVTWDTPTEATSPVAVTSMDPVTGNFYAETSGQTSFVATPTDTPAFGQTFPDIAFNPTKGSISGDLSGVSPSTLPFTDITTDVTGTANGTIPAQGNGVQAGEGTLQSFDAVFTTTLHVSQAGDLSYSLQAADGFLLGIGNGASRVSGDFLDPTASLESVFDSYPLAAAYDTTSGGHVLDHPFTVHFPSAGSYPLEIDYFSAGATPLSLVLTPSQAVPSQANTPPLNVYVGYEDNLRAANDYTVSPLPWSGSSGVIFEGDSTASGSSADTGGIRLDNVTNAPITIDQVTVDIPVLGGNPPTTFNEWPNDIVVNPGQTLILAEDNGYASFDTSDVDSYNCNVVVPNLAPQINVTIGGTTTTYSDTAEVLNWGGYDPGNCGGENESEPWVRVGTSGPANPVAPSARTGAAGGWDTATNALVAFGGYDNATNTYLGDTWVWQQNRWTDVAPATAPSARAFAAGAYDQADGQFVLFGGFGSNGQDFTDTWTFNGTTWTQQSPAHSPPALTDATEKAVYDAATKSVVLVTSNSFGSGTPDTWTWDGTDWTEHASATQLPARWNPTLAYDPDTKTVIAFGGASPYADNSAGDLADTWQWDGTNWTQLSPAASPTARFGATMDYDPARGGLILFGGDQGSTDTWLYKAGTWTQISPTNSPPGRDNAISAYDPVDQRELIAFGSQSDGGQWAGGTDLGDLWLFDGQTWGITTGAPNPVPGVASLALSPSGDQTYQAGHPLELSASAFDGAGQPIAGATVDYTIAGANPATGHVTTNADGSAEITDPGTNGGTDTIQATATVGSIGLVSNVPSVTWTAPAPLPTVTITSPTDGSTVTSPSPVTATVTPPANQTIASWSATIQSSTPGSTPVTIGSGTGSPPATLGTLDPTALANGTYSLSVSAVASGTGTQTVTETVDISGQMKLGFYQATYQELSVPVRGLQMTVDRVYNSLDTGSGDFGPGWHVDVSNFQVGSGRPLGSGGWTEYPTACSLFGCNYGYQTTNVDHSVTVTWPDGHQEKWDLTPTGGSFAGLQFVSPSYTPRAGTNTVDTLTSGGSLVFGGDGNLYNSVFAQVSDGTLFDPTQFTLTTPAGDVYQLSTTTGLISETDAAGNSITIDGTGIHGSNGQSITFTRDAAHGNRITEIAGPDDGVNGQDQHWIYAYNSAGQLESVTDPSTTVNYTYNSFGQLTGSTDSSGNVLLTITYGPDGRVQSVANGPNAPSVITSEPSSDQEVVKSPNGLTTTYTYDSSGNLAEQVQTVGSATYKTSYTYDSSGRQTGVTDPDGGVTTTAYDETPGPTNGDVLSETDADGRTTTYGAYSDTGQPGETINPDGTVASVATFDPNLGLLASLDIPGQSPTSYTYNPDGTLSTLTDPTGDTYTYTYDTNGNPSSVTDSAGLKVKTVADAAGHVVSQTDALGNTTTYTYDGNGNITSELDPGATSPSSAAYNAFGEETTATDAAGDTTNYTYDGAGNMLTRVEPGGATTSYSYAPDGALTAEATPTGTTHFTYDALDRIVEADNQNQQLDFTYDGDGNVLTQTTCAPQASGHSCPAGSPVITRTYDADGNITSTRTPAGVTSYGYDTNNLLTTVTDPSGSVFAYGYDSYGLQTFFGRPNGTSDTWTYNDLNMPLSLTTTGPGGKVLAKATNTVDPDTQLITSMTDLDGTNTYTDSADGMLLSATHPAASHLPDESYTYDAAGNRATGPSPSTVSSYNAANELLTDGLTNFTWNGLGDMTSQKVLSNGVTTSYTWDADSELTAADSPTVNATYKYDPFGRMISQTSNGVTTTYTWDVKTLVAETTAGKTTAMVTDPAPGDTFDGAPTDAPAATVEVISPTSTYYPVTNMHGDWTTATTASGTPTQAVTEYSAFGIPNQASSLPLGFDGYIPTATGLDYTGGRWYDPANGIFLSPDVVPAVNPYTYTGASPINYFDPSGNEAIEDGEILASEEAALASGEADLTVYKATDVAGNCYVGITNNFARRALQHDGRFQTIVKIEENLTRGQARVVEQQVIRAYGLGGKAGQTGQLLNKINSISGGPLFRLGAADTVPFLDIAATLANFSGCP